MAESVIPEGSRKPQLVDLLALQLCAGVGTVICRRLLRVFGSVQGLLAAPLSRIEEVEGVGPKRANALIGIDNHTVARKEIQDAREMGVQLLDITNPAYPPALKQIYDPPLVLYVKGDLRAEDALAIGVVGARSASYYGKEQAVLFSSALAGMGFTIISGLARGADSSAHQAALDAGGRTIAVMGCGLAGIYPAENQELADNISGNGALLSECPLHAPPTRESFPRRNRLISALSLGVLVVEGSRRSGSLITARCALEQGREVFAIPGRNGNALAAGPNSLIQKAGAKLVTCPQDLLDELGPVADELVVADVMGAASFSEKSESRSNVRLPAKGLARLAGLNGKERAVLDVVKSEAQRTDRIVESTKLLPAEVASALVVLEVRRLVKRLPGGRYLLVGGHN